jgi:hypothetical protein
MRIRKIGPGRAGALERLHCLFRPQEPRQHEAAIEMRLGVPGSESKGTLETRKRLFVPTGEAESDAEPKVRFRVPRPQPHGLW